MSLHSNRMHQRITATFQFTNYQYCFLAKEYEQIKQMFKKEVKDNP